MNTNIQDYMKTHTTKVKVPHVRTALAQSRAFAVTGPSTWNGLPPLLRAQLSLCSVFPLHMVILLRRFFSLQSFRAESASD